MKSRSDNAIMEKRVRMVQQWLLEDHPTHDIVSFCIGKWDVSKRQAYRYLSHAMEKFREANEKSVEQKVNYYLARKRKLIHDMPDAYKKTPQGVAAINNVLNSMAVLEGIHLRRLDPNDKEKKDLPVSETHRFENLTTEQIEQILGKHTE
jgi:hypothetical protein